MRRSNFRAAGVLFIGLLVLLVGCPTGDNESYEGESYIDAAVLVNEKAKYQTAVTFYFDESDAGTDVTEQFIQLLPGKSADRDISVSIDSAGGSGYFALRDGRTFFTGIMPMEEDFVKEEEEDIDSSGKEPVEERGNIAGEVITLSFQKGAELSTLEVLGIIRKKGTENDAERIAVSEESTFVLYGYDVINSAYINRGDVKITHPILDVTKVNAADMVRQTATTASNWESATGETVKELFESLNAAASAEYKGVLFSGKAEAEFSTSSNSKQTTRYAKGRGFQITKDEFLRQASPTVLKDLLDDTFRADILSRNASYILNTYGTHLIARSYWGGSAEFNYSYTGSELTDDQALKTALSATYGKITGEVSVDAQRKATELKNNSSFSSSSRGGNNTSFMTSDQFTSGYDAWVQSVKNAPSICGIPNFNNDLIPIWTIVAEINAAKATAIKQEFDKLVAARGIALDGYKYVPPQPTYTYVTAIEVREQSSESIPSGYTNMVKTDMYNHDAGGVLDANQGAGGAWIRIPYKREMGNNNHNAIADLWVYSTGKSSSPPNVAGWTAINFDLNKGAGGPYLWLLYRRVNSSDTMAISSIGSYSGDSAGSGQILAGYEWVNTGGRVDLNLGAGGKYLYLTMHKVPFKW